MVHVHGTLRSLQQLEEFPFDMLYAPSEMEFWRLVISNFYLSACIILHALTNDKRKDTHSLLTFRSWIMEAKWASESKRDILKATLKERKFDARSKGIADRLSYIRHKRIAHRLLSDEGRKQGKNVELDELCELFDATHLLFGALSFGSAYITLAGDLMPSIVQGEPAETCLDRVLDAVLRSNYVVNQPEQHADRWRIMRKCIQQEELQLMNVLRKRIDLPEA